MKKLIIIALALASGQVHCQSTPAELGVAAIGLVVTDIDASEEFYTTLIGMRPTGGFQLDDQWSRDAGAANGRPFAVKTFRMQDTETATVLKLAYFDQVPDRPVQSGVDSFAGVNYITLHYADLEPVLKRIRDAGVPLLGEVRARGYRLVFLRDPDGVFLELVGPPVP